MSALKDIYSPSFYNFFADIAETVLSSFDRKKFSKEIFNKDWKSKELKQRMRHTSTVLHRFLHDDFEKAAKQIEKIAFKLQQSKATENTFGFMFLPDYIEVYGLNNFKASVNAIELVTQFVNCEYAVRPFIIKYKSRGGDSAETEVTIGFNILLLLLHLQFLVLSPLLCSSPTRPLCGRSYCLSYFMMR